MVFIKKVKIKEEDYKYFNNIYNAIGPLLGSEPYNMSQISYN